MLGVPICRPGDSGSARLALTALVEGFEASSAACPIPRSSCGCSAFASMRAASITSSGRLTAPSYGTW